MKRLVLCMIAIGLLSIAEQIGARSVLARHEERFFKEVNRRPLAIALFYRDNRAARHCDADDAEIMLRAERIFERLSTNCRFKEGGLIFIKASILHRDMQYLARSYGITQIPACILFKESELVRERSGKIAILYSLHSQESLVQFIKKYLSRELDENREEYWRRQEVRALNGPQVSVGFGVGWWGPGFYDPLDYYPWAYYGGWGRGYACGRRGCCNSNGCHRSCRK